MPVTTIDFPLSGKSVVLHRFGIVHLDAYRFQIIECLATDLAFAKFEDALRDRVADLMDCGEIVSRRGVKFFQRVVLLRDQLGDSRSDVTDGDG